MSGSVLAAACPSCRVIEGRWIRSPGITQMWFRDFFVTIGAKKAYSLMSDQQPRERVQQTPQCSFKRCDTPHFTSTITSRRDPSQLIVTTCLLLLYETSTRYEDAPPAYAYRISYMYFGWLLVFDFSCTLTRYKGFICDLCLSALTFAAGFLQIPLRNGHLYLCLYGFHHFDVIRFHTLEHAHAECTQRSRPLHWPASPFLDHYH